MDGIICEVGGRGWLIGEVDRLKRGRLGVFEEDWSWWCQADWWTLEHLSAVLAMFAHCDAELSRESCELRVQGG